MIVRLHEIPEGGLEVEGQEPADILELEEAAEVRGMQPVSYELSLQLVSSELIVKGNVLGQLELECSRCGVFFWTNCGNSAFLRAYQVESGSDEIDITPDLREAVLLGIPSFPVCSEECEGLCPYCGINLNRESCECEPPKSDDRWDVLDKLDI